MYTFLTTIFLAAVLLGTSCTKSQTPVTFQSGGTLSSAERQSLVNLHQGYANWQPEFSAVYGQGEDAHHVCLLCPWGSVVYSYSVFVFDAAGRLTEANVIDAPSGFHPVELLSISPLQVTFAGGNLPNGKRTTKGLYYLHEAGHRQAVEYGRWVLESQKSTNSTQTDRPK